MSDLPALSGYELIRLLELDGWQRGMRGTHGQSMYKYFASEARKRVGSFRVRALDFLEAPWEGSSE